MLNAVPAVCVLIEPMEKLFTVDGLTVKELLIALV